MSEGLLMTLTIIAHGYRIHIVTDRVGRVNDMGEGAWDIVSDIIITSILWEILISHQWDPQISKVTLSYLDTLTPLLRWFSSEEA